MPFSSTLFPVELFYSNKAMYNVLTLGNDLLFIKHNCNLNLNSLILSPLGKWLVDDSCPCDQSNQQL